MQDAADGSGELKDGIESAAKGNQKPSFSAPTMKGIKPKIVETTVRKIGITFVFHAFT